MMRKLNFKIIEVLVCLLLLAYLLYVSITQNRTEKENIREMEKVDMQKEQESIGESEQRGNDILTDASEEIKENAERIFPVLTDNPNPYFFPNDVLTVTYNCNTQNSQKEKISEQIKMLVCREKAFPEGILYSLKAENGESVSENNAESQEKEVLELGCFYVQAEKIYLIRDLEIRQDTTEEDLMEAGTVICQSESKAEDEHTRNVFGPHEMIKVADGKCAFYGHYDNRETDNFHEYYEYFIWQLGEGLIAYRSGNNETEEDIALCMGGVEKIGFEDENVFNPYFFPEDKTIIEYEGEFYLDGMLPENEPFPRKMKVKLSVEKERVLENGILYRMDILNNDKFYFDDSETGRQGRKRMHLGYFYVQTDKIYLIRDMEIDWNITEKELIEYGKVICQPEPRGDIIEPEEKGWHEGISILGDECLFGGAANYIETDWWESFIWQKGVGLVEYKSGRGAFSDAVYITIIP